MRMIVLVLVALAALAALAPVRSHADPSSPAVEERRQPPATTTADTEYDRGVRARLVSDWGAAVDALRSAIKLRSDFPDAWNELGFALRQQGRYGEALDAYREALRLRPDFPEALEYLGEAYVNMGQVEEARRVLDRLRRLDAARAQHLATAIANAR